MGSQVWVDGPAFQDLNRRQAEMAETRESIEALRKAIKKQLPLPGGPPAEGGSRQARKDLAGTITPAEYVIRDEALRVRISLETILEFPCFRCFAHCNNTGRTVSSFLFPSVSQTAFWSSASSKRRPSHATSDLFTSSWGL